MSLVLALKNHDSVVVASDVDRTAEAAAGYGQFMNLPGRSILLIAGNLDVVRKPIEDKVMPKLNVETSAAALAQYLQAALVLEVVPHIAELRGRVELIVAGIDPVRHVEEPSIYYLDSARDFYLTVVPDNMAAAGSTAAMADVLRGRDLTTASTEELVLLAKDCLATTKLRWPDTLAAHQRLGIITFNQTRILDF